MFNKDVRFKPGQIVWNMDFEMLGVLGTSNDLDPKYCPLSFTTCGAGRFYNFDGMSKNKRCLITTEEAIYLGFCTKQEVEKIKSYYGI